ncbi:MAG: CDP-diacylglycerol--glycerol-3-phosphate 3-phosphatidyltransferase [Pseudomonadales bacterium]|jgi:CDP-diacylglycerol--glycerol-3-phosphate 3-phosphatidyltransferase
MTIPNILTTIRVLLIPVIIVVFYLDWVWAGFWASILFGVASFTDWLDGYLARRLDQGSAFGAFLDPVADKLTVSVALILITTHYPAISVTIATIIIIGREIIISALREWMAKAGQSHLVAVDAVGKWKTAAQMLAIGFLMGSTSAPTAWGFWPGYVLLVLATLLTIWSMVGYLRSAMPVILQSGR